MRRGARLVGALIERIGEIAPPDFEVTTVADGHLLVIRGIGPRAGSSSTSWPGMFLRLPLPASLRLRILFENVASDVQEFFEETLRRAQHGAEMPRDNVGEVAAEYAAAAERYGLVFLDA